MKNPVVPSSMRVGSTRPNERHPEPDLRLLFDNAPIGMYQSTIEGRYLLVNQAFVEMLGYDEPEEVLALDIPNDVYLDPADRDVLVARASEGAVQGADVRLKRRDGSAITVSLHTHGIRDGSGRTVSFVGSAMDVTSHREAEQRLRESRDELTRINSQLRVVYEQIPAVVWTTDRKLRFTSSQGKGLALLGLAPDEVVGMTVEEYLGEKADDLALHRLALRGESQRYETEFGKYVFNCSLDPLRDSDGSIVGTIGTAMEISTQRKLEERLREAQKMEGLALLAGGIAHDFNNLLVGILGNADLALQHAPGTGRLNGILERLRLSAQRASDLTNQLLAYSGRGQFVNELISLNGLVEEMAALLRSSISKNASFTIELDPDGPTTRGDPAQIRQVVMNLITNASDAVDEGGGTIGLKTRRIERARERGECDTYSVLDVVDDGCGMDAETRARIFDPFFTTKLAGHGLGLAAVQGILRGHGGEIEVESVPGCGTTVRVLLPSVDRESASSLRPSSPSSSVAVPGARALVVDDEETVRQVAVGMLEQLGLEAVAVSNGNEALALLESQPDRFQVVLLDMTMPGLSGEETLVRIRSMERAPAVVLVSGYDGQRATGRPVSLGEAAFLKKPFLLERLEEILASLMKR